MTTVLTIVGAIVLAVLIEAWPNGLDRRLRAKRKAAGHTPRKARRAHYVIGRR